MQNIVEFLVNTSSKQKGVNSFKIAYFDGRKSYYIYLLFDPTKETDDVKNFYSKIINGLNDSIKDLVKDEIDEYIQTLNNINHPNGKINFIGIRFKESTEDNNFITSYTHFKWNLDIKYLDIYEAKTEDILKCTNFNWEDIKKICKKK